MFQPTHRRPEYGIRQRSTSGVDGFMFGNAQPPIRRSSFAKQQLNPLNLLNSPHISKGIDGFSGILDNVQQVLKIVDTTTPLIKEYGPMIKNLPAMYRMVKAFKEVDSMDDETEKDIDVSKDKDSVVHENEKDSIEQSENVPKETVGETSRKSNGVSTPKLYI